MASSGADTFAGVRFTLGWAVIALTLGIAVAVLPYDGLGGGMVVALAVTVIGIFLIPKMFRGPDARLILYLLAIGLVAKIAATIVRLYITFNLYPARDAEGYHRVGSTIAGLFHAGEFSEATAYFGVGTTFLQFFTGLVYTVFGSTLLGGFIFFSFLAILGSAFFIKAFRVASPSGNWKLFAILVLFWPSVLYWPAGIGKDAVIFLFAGIASYGAALLLARGRWSGMLPIAIGLLGAFLVRPHIAVLFAAAVTVALLVAMPKRSGRDMAMQLMLVTVGIAASVFVLAQAASFLGITELTPAALFDYVEAQEDNPFRFTESGSNFQMPDATNPLRVPMAFITVLFRPFPWEAHNAQALAQSLDGIALGLLMLWGLARLGRALLVAPRQPYVIYTLVVGVALILALSALGNFGLLARQRAMVLPFVFALMTLAPSYVRATADEAAQAVRSARGPRAIPAVGRRPVPRSARYAD